jgi:hypothetical protein
VGALCFSRGEQRFSVAEKSWTLICALALASKKPGLKCLREKSEKTLLLRSPTSRKSVILSGAQDDAFVGILTNTS